MPLHSLSSSRLLSPAITDWLDLVDSFLIRNWRVKQMKREILLKFSFAWDLFSVFIYMMRGGQEREKAMFYPFICPPDFCHCSGRAWLVSGDYSAVQVSHVGSNNQNSRAVNCCLPVYASAQRCVRGVSGIQTQARRYWIRASQIPAMLNVERQLNLLPHNAWPLDGILMWVVLERWWAPSNSPEYSRSLFIWVFFVFIFFFWGEGVRKVNF